MNLPPEAVPEVGVERRFEIDSQLYPFESHWHWYGGAPMHYLDEGSGPAVLLLHGNPTWSFLYRNVILELAGSCRCIAPDYPGFGLSGHPETYGYSPAEHAAAVLDLIDNLELEHFCLYVQDWGGPIGMAVAGARPERITGLVIGNSWCWEPPPSLWLFSKLMGSPVGRYLILQHNLFADSIVRNALGGENEPEAGVLEAYLAPFPDRASRIGTWTFPRAIAGEQVWLRSLERDLTPLRDRPVELLWGERDSVFSKPKFDERWRLSFPNAYSERITDAGHFFQEDRPDRASAAALRLLDRI